MQEIKRRGLKVAIAGIPKTIDNDIPVLGTVCGLIAVCILRLIIINESSKFILKII